MKQAFRLLELIGEVDEQLVEASLRKPNKKHKINPWPYLIAAVLALALIGGGTAFLRWGGNVIHGQDAGEATAESVMAAEPAEAPAAAEEAAEVPAEGATEEDAEAEADEAVETEEAVAEDIAEDQKEREESEADPAVADFLENLTIGSLYLGMPEAEVLSALGEPQERSESFMDTDGITRMSFFYKLGDSPEWRNDLTVTLADNGTGYLVDSLYGNQDCGLAINQTITMGGDVSQITALGLPFTEETSQEQAVDENGELKDTVEYHYYSLNAGNRGLSIEVKDGIVFGFNYGTYYPGPDLSMDDGSYEPPYLMSGDPITVYARQEDGWREIELTGQDAKRLEVILNIEELLPGDDLRRPQYVIDFHSGTVASLCGNDDGGAVYTCPEGVAFSPDMLDALDSELELYMNCTFPEGVWDTVKELTGT